jgi:SAM-dependent methyltransferase
MAVSVADRSTPRPGAPTLTSRLIGGLLSVKPVWAVARHQARSMMIRRAERLGIPWSDTVADLRALDWQPRWQAVADESLTYPANYRASFHGYDAGHLCWEAAFEFEVASRAVHAPLYPDVAADSDRALRRGYQQVLAAALPQPPAVILDLHCTVGLSSFALRQAFPGAEVTGLDFSPHYLAVAQHHNEERQGGVCTWRHALPEATGLSDRSFDLVSAFLLFHEMPAATSRRIFREARRLVRPGGSFALMDMNPACGAYQTMPATVMTLLRSTEPYMEQYFALDLEEELLAAGFDAVSCRPCSPRHRAVIATVTV